METTSNTERDALSGDGLPSKDNQGFAESIGRSKSEIRRRDEVSYENKINIGEYSYDISNFNHPGGNIIKYMTSGQDATHLFEEFHYRSKTAKLILHSLPKTKIVSDTCLTTEQQMLDDFVRFRKSLEDRGFFAPSYFHITYRMLELFAIYLFAVYAMQHSIAASIILLGLFGGRCGWVQHEGGHNSFTGNIKLDKIIQNVVIGFGLLADGSLWNSMHNKHHATTQKIGYDMDLDTAPFVLFYPSHKLDVQKQIFERLAVNKEDVCENETRSLSEFQGETKCSTKPISRRDEVSNENQRNPSATAYAMHPEYFTTEMKFIDKAAKWWLKYQMYTFLPITSGIFVVLFWSLYLHPHNIIGDKNILQAFIVLFGHLSRIRLFMRIGNASLQYALLYHLVTLWVSGVYLFGHFSLSHTFMPTIESHENPNWVRYSVEHTVDIEPQNYAVSWIMGHLNNQVVHHLFPSMPQYRGPAVSKELIEFCKKWDLKYTIISYREAWYAMFSNLHKVGNEVYNRVD